MQVNDYGKKGRTYNEYQIEFSLATFVINVIIVADKRMQQDSDGILLIYASLLGKYPPHFVYNGYSIILATKAKLKVDVYLYHHKLDFA